MIPGLVDHLWQSTLFVGAAWLLTLALRRNRAQVRYWIWFAASVKFLIPFSVLVSLGTLAPRHPAPALQTGWLVAPEQIIEPLTTLPAVAARVDATADGSIRKYLAAALTLWACGFAAVAICWLVRWTRVHALRRLARPSNLEFPVPVMSAPGRVEPGIIGIFRPVLLLPEGIGERLSPAQLDAILAHELCHVCRKDNLTAAIHMIVQATFWFHPLVWWLGARLVDERERACDEEVLRLGSTPQVYAEGILNVCRLYVESQLACVSGVTGSNLKRRIEAIMKNRIALRLNLGKKLVLAVTGIAAVAAPIAIGVLNAPVVLGQSRAQSAPVAATPKWEVASIRPCRPEDGGGGGRSGDGGSSPGTLNSGCQTVKTLILTAYAAYADGHVQPPPLPPLEGGPPWINSARYRIIAKPEGAPSQGVMMGPMLQGLLEERFKLRIRRESREVPAYALTVAKSGPKLKPSREGSCLDIGLVTPLTQGPPAPRDPNQMICGMNQAGKQNPPNVTLEVRGVSLDYFAKVFLRIAGERPVVNNTGIKGLFDIHLEFGPDETTPELGPLAAPSDPTGGPSIFTAVQEQLGLKLEPTKGLGEFLVIDSVERPSEN